MERVEASNADKCPTVHRTVPTARGYQAPRVSSAEAEAPAPGEWPNHNRDLPEITWWVGRAGMETSLPDS